jgi:hypothetical protein
MLCEMLGILNVADVDCIRENNGLSLSFVLFYSVLLFSDVHLSSSSSSSIYSHNIECQLYNMLRYLSSSSSQYLNGSICHLAVTKHHRCQFLVAILRHITYLCTRTTNVFIVKWAFTKGDKTSY